MTRPSSRLIPLTLIAAGLWAYHNSLAVPFLFDDHESITFNPHLRSLWPLWRAMVPPTPSSVVAGRPLVGLTLALNYALGGLHVFGYHLVNVAAHVVSTLLVYGIVRRTLRGPRFRDRDGADAQGLAIALLWTVHPLLTESVTYVVQRTELLMGLCLLLALYSLIRAADTWPRRGWPAVAVVSCALGMLSKEVMVVAPVLVWIYDWMFLARSGREWWQRRRALYLGLASTWILLALLLVTTHHPAASLAFTRLTPWDYALTQCGVLLHYLRLSVWPHPLALDYFDWPVTHTLAQAWPDAAVIGGLLAGTCWALARRRPLGMLGAWFLLVLAPTSSALPIITEIAAERRMYLPLIAVVCLVVIGGWRWLGRLIAHARPRRITAASLVAAVAVLLSGVTVRRNQDYHTEASIWRETLATRPGNARAHLNLGRVLQDAGQWEAAVAQYRDALRLSPRLAEAHYNLGTALAEAGRAEEAIGHYRDALRWKPGFVAAHYNLALALEDRGQWEASVAEYQEALRFAPQSVEAHNNLGLVLVRLGRIDDAIAHEEAALRLAPGSLLVLRNLQRARALRAPLLRQP